MTEERSKPGTEDMTDPAVSSIYRDLARERTPASLNESILRQAARGAGHGYSHSLAWLRPMAWAATIGLSLAIVIELAEIPQADLTRPGNELRDATLPDPRVEADSERLEPPASQASRSDRAAQPGGDAQPVNTLGTPSAAAIRDRKSSEALRSQLGRIERPQTTMADDKAPERQGPASDVSAFRVTGAPALEEAAAAARLRGGAEEEALEGSTNAAAGRNARSCGADAQDVPEAWLECIKELRESGREDEADEQQRQLLAAFPDFVIP